MVTQEPDLAKPVFESSSRFSLFTYSDESDERLFAVVRCLLAFAGLAIVYVDPTAPREWVGANYGMLAAYCVFSGVVALDAFTRRRLPWRERPNCSAPEAACGPGRETLRQWYSRGGASASARLRCATRRRWCEHAWPGTRSLRAAGCAIRP